MLSILDALRPVEVTGVVVVGDNRSVFGVHHLLNGVGSWSYSHRLIEGTHTSAFAFALGIVTTAKRTVSYPTGMAPELAR
jgi:hypothetical protein